MPLWHNNQGEDSQVMKIFHYVMVISDPNWLDSLLTKHYKQSSHILFPPFKKVSPLTNHLRIHEMHSLSFSSFNNLLFWFLFNPKIACLNGKQSKQRRNETEVHDYIIIESLIPRTFIIFNQCQTLSTCIQSQWTQKYLGKHFRFKWLQTRGSEMVINSSYDTRWHVTCEVQSVLF